LDVDRQADAAASPARARIHRFLLGTGGIVVEAAKKLVEERGEITRVIDGSNAERLGAAVVRHLAGGDQVASSDLGRVDAEPGGGLIQEALAPEGGLLRGTRG